MEIREKKRLAERLEGKAKQVGRQEGRHHQAVGRSSAVVLVCVWLLLQAAEAAAASLAAATQSKASEMADEKKPAIPSPVS